jgi:hypothetical protein
LWSRAAALPRAGGRFMNINNIHKSENFCPFREKQSGNLASPNRTKFPVVKEGE